MTKNPFINALSASVYITLVVTVMNFVTKPLQNKPDTFAAPIVFINTHFICSRYGFFIFINHFFFLLMVRKN